MSNIKKDMTPAAMTEVLGQRLRQARLNANIKQSELAEKAGVARNTVRNAENGKVTLEIFVALMQALDVVDHLDLFLPPPPVSPIQLMKMQGKQRVRASGDGNPDEKKESW